MTALRHSELRAVQVSPEEGPRPAASGLLDPDTAPLGEESEITESGVATVDGHSVVPGRRPQNICLVGIHSDFVSRRIDLVNALYTIGRAETNDIVIPSHAVSRVHARLVATNSGYDLVDADSTNGCFVNHRRLGRAPMVNGDLLVVGSTSFRYLDREDLDQAVAEVLTHITRTDGLTQAANRNHLVSTVTERQSRGLNQVVIALRVDRFAALESKYSKLALERTLVLLSGLLKDRVRGVSDLVARIGDDTFAIALEGALVHDGRRRAETLQRHIAQSTFRYHDAVIPISLETAVVDVPIESTGATDEMDHLLARLTAQLGG